jgi:peptidoglycan/LPS O-acetylase OafA/YrhL
MDVMAGRLVIKPEQHYPALDGLRGIAILMVMMHHFAIYIESPNATFRAAMRIVERGWLGVDLFFVLSGFLITRILLSMREAEQSIWVFYARRVLRIFPLYYAVLLLTIVLTPALAQVLFDRNISSHHTTWLWLYLSNIPLTFPQLGSVRSDLFGVSHFWTLAIEEQFYLLWPLVVLRGAPRTAMAVAWAMLPIGLVIRAYLIRAGVPSINADFFSPVRAYGLCIGAILAMGLRSRSSAYSSRLGWILLLLSATVTVLLFFLRKALGVEILPGADHLTMATFFASVIAVSVGSTTAAAPLNSFLSLPALRWFGRRSYGLYVWHALVQSIVIHAVRANRPAPRGMTDDVITIVLCFVVACVLSTISWHLLEKPFLSFKRHFAYERHSLTVRQAAAEAVK